MSYEQYFNLDDYYFIWSNRRRFHPGSCRRYSSHHLLEILPPGSSENLYYGLTICLFLHFLFFGSSIRNQNSPERQRGAFLRTASFLRRIFIFHNYNRFTGPDESSPQSLRTGHRQIRLFPDSSQRFRHTRIHPHTWEQDAYADDSQYLRKRRSLLS